MYNTTSSSRTYSTQVGVCLNSAHNVYIVDCSTNRILKFDNTGAPLLVIPSNATIPPLNAPWSCRVDSLGFIFGSNMDTNGGINKIAPNGTHVAFFNTTTPLLYTPRQIALDSAGALYVADSGNGRVVQLNSSTGEQQQGFALAAGGFPSSVAVDSQTMSTQQITSTAWWRCSLPTAHSCSSSPHSTLRSFICSVCGWTPASTSSSRTLITAVLLVLCLFVQLIVVVLELLVFLLFLLLKRR